MSDLNIFANAIMRKRNYRDVSIDSEGFVQFDRPRRKIRKRPDPPLAPNLTAPTLIRVDERQQPISQMDQFQTELKNHGLGRSRRRQVLKGLSRFEQRQMVASPLPATVHDPRRVCGVCHQWMTEEFHPAPNYLCKMT